MGDTARKEKSIQETAGPASGTAAMSRRCPYCDEQINVYQAPYGVMVLESHGCEGDHREPGMTLTVDDMLPSGTERFVVMVKDEAGRWYCIDETGNFVLKYAIEEMEKSKSNYPDDTYRIAVKRVGYYWPELADDVADNGTSTAEPSPSEVDQ